MTKKINITTIGGGVGTFNVIRGLKKVFPKDVRNISAIVTMTDSGGTTGEIRDKYGILPPGDVRDVMCALAANSDIVRELFDYKFKGETGTIGGNKVGNILITALNYITGSFEKGLDEACRMFDVEGKVLPVTLEDVHLGVKFEDGTEVIGEKYIDISDKNNFGVHNLNQNVLEAFLVGGDGCLNPKAKEAILNSDFIIIGPGDFYTSIIPNLLSKGMREALSQTQAKIIYVCNIMTKKGETTTYELPDFINNLEKYTGEVIDYVFVNNGYISDELVEKYRVEEGKKPVKLKPGMEFLNKKYKIVERDFVNESDFVRHDPEKLAKTIKDLTDGWIK